MPRPRRNAQVISSGPEEVLGEGFVTAASGVVSKSAMASVFWQRVALLFLHGLVGFDDDVSNVDPLIRRPDCQAVLKGGAPTEPGAKSPWRFPSDPTARSGSVWN